MKRFSFEDQESLLLMLARTQQEDAAVSQTVADVIAAVRREGDAAVFDYTRRFDGCSLTPDTLCVTERETREAYEAVPPVVLAAMRKSAENIRDFHEHQKEAGFRLPKFGGFVGQMINPVDAAGIYAPGGTAAYSSSVLMNLIPARVAGVGHIAMATPPGVDGRVNPATLVAADIAGADVVYKMGGAQAIAALAYGTKTVRRVDKITGPGNIYVANAKKQVFGVVGIDSFAGPSEILVIADSTANAGWIAADLLSQAEHDPNAAVILLTDNPALAAAVEAQIELQKKSLPRLAIVESALAKNAYMVVTADLAQAVELANAVAPEHLELCVQDPEALLPLIRNAGAVFLGNYAPEPFGDYFAGPNHTLPTSGTARFFSPLGVWDFCKRTSIIKASREGLAEHAEAIAAFARAEGLEAHARSIEIRQRAEE